MRRATSPRHMCDHPVQWPDPPDRGVETAQEVVQSDTASRNSFGDRGFERNVCLQVTLTKVIRDSVFGRAGFARPLTHFGRVHYALAARWCARAASRPRLRHRCKSGYRLCARVWAIKAPIAPSMTPRIVAKANFFRPSCIALKGIRQFRPWTVRNVHY